jgi:hypothetical protein
MGVHINVVFDVGIFFLDDGLVVEGGVWNQANRGAFVLGLVNHVVGLRRTLIH